MATCEKRIDGQIMSYPCTLEAGHEANGPDFDPEPCMTAEIDASVRRHNYWVNREASRDRNPPETIEEIEADAERALAESQVAEPEHNLRDGACSMRPLSSPEVAADSAEVCPVCSGSRRPAVLVENDEAIRAGQIHNPFSMGCSKRAGGEMALEGERCYICHPDEVEEQAPQFLHEVDRNARAYGYEVGKGHPVADVIEQTSPENPFMDPDWRNTIEGKEFMAAADRVGNNFETDPAFVDPAPVPTKQREGDQVLPAGGDRPVQDWMIQREHERYMAGFKDEVLPDAEPGATVIRSMTESKRVGIERYGQPLHTFDGRLNIRDLADELRDAFVYISKLQMTAEADKQTLVRMVAEAIEKEFITGGESDTRGFYAQGIAEVAVDRILDWVLIQKIGPEQVMPVRLSD